MVEPVRLFKKNLMESISDELKLIYNRQLADWIRYHYKGNLKKVWVEKYGIKGAGDIDLFVDDIPTDLGSIYSWQRGTLTISTKNKSLEGLFTEDSHVERLSIIDCENLETLDGLPAYIDHLELNNLPSLKTLQHHSKVKEVNVYDLLSKKFDEEEVKKAFKK
jgi:hypothetical protein